MNRTPSSSQTSQAPQAAARSLLAFGLYLCGTGALLVVAPALVLAPLQIAVPTDVWVRLVGILALALGCNDVLAARAGVNALIRASVWRRGVAAALIVALVALGIAPTAMLVFAAVDLGAALWTVLALNHTSSTSLAHS